MKFPRPVACAILALSAHLGASMGSGASFTISAVVNGKPITSSEVREAVKMQEQLIQMTVKDPRAAAARMGELRESALYALIERQLVLSEFEKLGGSIKPSTSTMISTTSSAKATRATARSSSRILPRTT